MIYDLWVLVGGTVMRPTLPDTLPSPTGLEPATSDVRAPAVYQLKYGGIICSNTEACVSSKLRVHQSLTDGFHVCQRTSLSFDYQNYIISHKSYTYSVLFYSCGLFPAKGPFSPASVGLLHWILQFRFA